MAQWEHAERVVLSVSPHNAVNIHEEIIHKSKLRYLNISGTSELHLWSIIILVFI